MNRTSPFSTLVKRPASSPAFSITGPLVFLIFTFIAFAMINANVVLPRPDGPLRRMCSSTSPRFLAASTINSRRSRTLTCPVNSLNAGGRREISKAASGSGGFICAFVEFISRNGKLCTDHSFYFFGQHQFRAAAFVYVIDFVKGITNEIQTKSARFDHIMRAAFHFMGKNLFAVIPHPHAHAFAQSFHAQ